jgi:hypothetical protein
MTNKEEEIVEDKIEGWYMSEQKKNHKE